MPAPEPDAPSTPEQVPFEFAAPATAPTPEAPKRHTYSWGELVKRTFAADVLTCAKCGGPRRIVACVFSATFACRHGPGLALLPAALPKKNCTPDLPSPCPTHSSTPAPG